MKKKTLNIIFIVLLIAFFIINVLLSDYFYLNAIMKENNINTPRDAYDYIDDTTDSTVETRGISNSALGDRKIICAYCSPSYILENDLILACDEGAIIIAHMSTLLGYETRLVDLVGYDNISHHTILEVYEDDEWVTYDYFFEDVGGSYTNKIEYDLKNPRYREYPKWYNKVIYSFYGLKYVVAKVRNVKG